MEQGAGGGAVRAGEFVEWGRVELGRERERERERVVGIVEWGRGVN